MPTKSKSVYVYILGLLSRTSISQYAARIESGEWKNDVFDSFPIAILTSNAINVIFPQYQQPRRMQI